jgi:pilus assembly protein FimV
VAAKPAAPTEVSAAAKGGQATQFADDELDLTEFNLDKPVASTPTPIAPKLAAAPSSTPAPLDLSSLSLDLGTSAPGTLAEAVPEQEGESAWHSVATKLDLARAYLEIGDKEGAREILQEVMNEGDADQRREAQTLSAALA